jgi:hypothetical protein
MIYSPFSKIPRYRGDNTAMDLASNGIIVM